MKSGRKWKPSSPIRSPLGNIRIAALIVLAITLALPAPAARKRLSFTVQVSPVSNLIYQLDCLSGFVNCSQNAYLHLWKTDLDWSVADQPQLDQWKLLRGKYRGPIRLNQPEAQPADLPWNGPTGLQLDEKFSIAAFHAVDQQSLRTHWEVIVSPTDLPKLESIIEHFQPRFSSWWGKNAQRKAERFRSELQKVLEQERIQAALASFARFYEVDVPDDYPVYLNLFLRPPSADTHTNGTQVENHAAVEFLPDEDVSRRLSVVIHELCHFFYSSSVSLQRRKLINSFASSQDPSSLAGWGLLNEVLATALGNGIAAEQLLDAVDYKKQLQTQRSFYNDVTIDAAAKALIPLLKLQISEHKTLYDPGFLTAYLTCLERRIPALLDMPARLLTEVTIIYGSEFEKAFQTKVRPQLSGGIYPFEGLENLGSWAMHEKYPKLNTLVLVSREELPALKRWVPNGDYQRMDKLFKTGTRWVYAVQQFPSTYLFVIGGQSDQDISNGFAELMKARQRFTRRLLE